MDEAAQLLRGARSVTVLTGAGVSAESGVPTFREAQEGIWSRYRPEDLASPEAFRRQPDVVWRWYQERHQALETCEPNPGHYALATLERHLEVTLITQNVDGLHHRAGTRDPVEIHGTLSRLRCSGHGHRAAWPPEAQAGPPSCPECGSLLRPDVVWFGETIAPNVLTRAWHATDACDLFLSVGTSNIVEPAASLPWRAARRGVPVLVVNVSMERQEQGRGIILLQGRAGVLLPEIVERAFPSDPATR